MELLQSSVQSIRPSRNASNASRCSAVVTLARGSRVPPISLIRLSKFRVQGTDQAAQRLAAHTRHAALLGTTEDPRVLNSIPEQRTLLLALLVVLAS